MMDYLAEVTMSILQKQKSRDATLGYATDFVPAMERILPLHWRLWLSAWLM